MREPRSLHAATRAGALDVGAREALVKYVLRPPIAQERVTERPEGLVRIALKRPFADGTMAIDLDPLPASLSLGGVGYVDGWHIGRAMRAFRAYLESPRDRRARRVPSLVEGTPSDPTTSSAAGAPCCPAPALREIDDLTWKSLQDQHR